MVIAPQGIWGWGWHAGQDQLLRRVAWPVVCNWSSVSDIPTSPRESYAYNAPPTRQGWVGQTVTYDVGILDPSSPG